jgi:predicted site-specific integrase-resolvase
MEPILTPEQVADLYGVSLETLRRWRRTGEGPAFVQLSARRVVYRPTDCEIWETARTFNNRAAAVAVVPSVCSDLSVRAARRDAAAKRLLPSA